mgnify:CR=1 FL=1
MKRALPGSKSKQATPARKLAAKRSTVRSKSKPVKSAAKKSAPVKKVTPPATKTKAAKSKITRKKVATVKAAKPKRSLITKRKAVKPSVTKAVLPPAPKPNTVKAKVVRRKPTVSDSRIKPARAMVAREVALDVPPSGEVPITAPAKRKVSQKAVRKVARKTARKAEFTLPAFLLEGDEPSHPLSGSGEKFALGPTPPLDHFDEAKAPLPDSYGTGRLFLTARDPHWLYAHWDFTMQEQFRHNARSMDRHMVLRLHDADQPGPHISEVHVHPESRHWFTHVDEAGKNYFTEIGYYQAGRKWKSLAVSAPQRTPPDNISADATIEFATIPLELPFETMLALLKETDDEAAASNVPLARNMDKIHARARGQFPKSESASDWTPGQAEALAEILAAAHAGVARPSSEEFVAEQPWPEFAFDFESGEAAPLVSPSSYVSSFFGGEGQKDFWFNVNAELIVYGATEPNATVTFSGKKIPLHADGSFRFHFALPDGQYELPVTAVSADGTDGRAAELKFTRATEIRGHVGTQPQASELSPPPSESA